MMKSILRTLFFLLFVASSSIAEAQSLKSYTNKRKQEQAERKRMEDVNYQKACNAGTLDAYQEYVSMYPNGKHTLDVKQRITEIEKRQEQDLYDYASRVETIQSYEAYIKRYPNGRYVQEAKGRIDDMSLWKDARSKNTIEAYRHYLNASKNKSYESLANDAITDLESIEKWNSIRTTNSASTIEDFISKFPKSSKLSDATKRLDELKAVELYKQGDYQRAYEKFNAAGGRDELEYSNRSIYDNCLEHVEYSRLSSYSTTKELQSFLIKYPSSQYYNQVSNMVAVAKARSLSMYSGEYDFNEALSYAKDKPTRHIVENYIDDSKRTYRHHKRQIRHNKIMENGGYVLFGIDVTDFSANGFAYKNNDYKVVVNYNFGVSVKFGNYKAPVQFEIGAKPGMLFYDNDDYDSDYYTTKTKFHLPFYAKLKLNMFNWADCRCYIAGLGWYNAIRDDNYENEYSVGGGFGFAWRHWDWLTLYFKSDIDRKVWSDDKFLGTSFIYYF